MAELFSDPVRLAQFTADARGTFSVAVTIPLGTSPGIHTLRVRQLSGKASADTILSVSARTTPLPTTPALSRTGTDVRGPALVALALLVSGFVLVALSWTDRLPAGFDARRPPWPSRRRPWG